MTATIRPLPLSGAPLPPAGIGAGRVLAEAEAWARAFAAILGLRVPAVVPLGRLDRSALLSPGAAPLLEGGFFAGFIPDGRSGLLVVNEAAAGLLPAEVIPALIAHEIGHAADWCLRLRLATLGLLPGPTGRRLALGLSALSPERFADRVAASLVGTGDVVALYLAAFRLQGGVQRHQARLLAALHGLPDRPSLPPTLRLARARARTS